MKPKRWILFAICRICFLEWVRALRAYGLRLSTGIASTSMRCMVRFLSCFLEVKAEVLVRLVLTQHPNKNAQRLRASGRNS